MPTVLWDWNGTLLNDVDMAVRVTNEVFAPRGYQLLNREQYQQCFRFPVQAYYRARGVEDADFPEVARAWSEGYAAAFSGTPLFADAAETVLAFHAAGFRQVILSASQRAMLQEQVDSFPSLRGLLDEVLGVDDIYAHGKEILARNYLTASGLDPAETVLLGDTCHDAEVAAAIGCRCLLVARGHQAEAVLEQACVPVLHSLREASDVLLGRRDRPPETARLLLTDLQEHMIPDVHRNSLDADNRRFVPDEVFETEAEAAEAVRALIAASRTPEGPWVLPILRRKDAANIGYVQAVRVEEGWEVGYHIAAPYTGQGYATEALRAALPFFARCLQTNQLLGVVLEENAASCRVLEKCGFALVFRGAAPYQGAVRPIRRYRWAR